jgi:Pentapeptide repeats (8 copies)
MANQKHLDILRQGVKAWNLWREEHTDIQPDLCDAKLICINLNDADLHDTDLSSAKLIKADLSGASLRRAVLVETDLTEASLTCCNIYGIAAWNVEMKETTQNDLVITPPGEPTITVDNLEVAQFIYLLLNNPKIRDVIDTIARKAVLILGRFTPERKAVLDALREALRTHGYVPILFGFDKPSSRDLTETVSTLAHLARFIIVDLTDPSSAPHEVATVIPHTIVPVQPLLWREPLVIDGRVVERREYAMFQDLRRRHDWVLPTHYYTDQATLLATLKEDVIEPAERKAQELAKR